MTFKMQFPSLYILYFTNERFIIYFTITNYFYYVFVIQIYKDKTSFTLGKPVHQHKWNKNSLPICV